MSFVKVLNGSYRGEVISNQVFELVQDLKEGKQGSFITVRPNESIGLGRDKIRIKLEAGDFEHVAGSGDLQSAVKVVEETDEEVMNRIESRFSILTEMTKASINGNVRAMIVSGPPGVGKSFGVESELEKSSLFDNIKKVQKHYEIVKGAMTPIGLYATLYNYSDKGNVLVFDDCDSILLDDLSLNILKAALDSGKRRRIFWNSDSSYLRKEGIPDSFDFKGSVIFISNIKFDNIKSKKLQDHLEALQSRCHYIDLTMNSMRDKFLRIKQIHRTGDLFGHYYFQGDEGDQVIEYMDEQKDHLREISLRMALKLADLIKISPDNWKNLAAGTCLKNSY